MLACNYDVCKNGLVQNYKKDFRLFIGNCSYRYLQKVTVINGPLYIITANFQVDSIMNIVTSYEWFVRYCVWSTRSIDFCQFFLINSLNYQWKSVEKIPWNGSISSLTCPLILPEENWKDFLRRFMMRMKISVSYI